jgi:hypothetical protein
MTHLTVRAGDAVVIPGNVLHFVYTPEDSVAVGVNFLSMPELEVSLKTFQLEREEKIPRGMCFPHFEAVVIMVIYHAWRCRGDAWVSGRLLKLCLETIRRRAHPYVTLLTKHVRVSVHVHSWSTFMVW